MNAEPGPVRRIPVRNPKLAWREVDGEILIISPDDSQLHELNATASAIWKSADGALDVTQIAVKLACDYDVAPGVAMADTAELIELLTEKSLLLRAPAAGEINS